MGTFYGDFTAETGTVTVEIDGASIVSGSGYFYINDIGKLEFSNDVPNKDENNPSSIATKQGGIQVTVRDTMSNGTSLYSSLSQLTLNQQLECSVTVNGLKTQLAIDYRNIKYDARTENVTLGFRPRWVYIQNEDVGSSSFFNIEYPINEFYTTHATASNLYRYRQATSNVSGVSLHDMVDDWMNFVYGTGTTYIKSASRVSATQPTGLMLQDIGASASIAEGDIHYIVPTAQTYGVLATISRFSALEGSTFGNAFGVNFYINRLYTGSDATATFRPEINYNYVADLDIFREKTDISAIGVNMYKSAVYATSTADNLGITLNEDGKIVYTLDFKLQGANSAIYVYDFDGMGTDLFQNESDASIDTVQAGVRSYSKALGADGSQRIKFKFRNALSLKPYQAFTLSSGTPAVFRASGASSVIYRPSRLFYDFKGDFVEGEAYAIGAV